jgi:hypothetical protein
MSKRIVHNMRITNYLWSCPDMPLHYRLPLGVLYIPWLVWRWFVGKPVLLGCYIYGNDS